MSALSVLGSAATTLISSSMKSLETLFSPLYLGRKRRARRFREAHHPATLTTRPRFKVLLIHPTTYEDDGETPFKAPRVSSPALTLPLLAALCPPHWDVELCYETCEEIPWDTDADVVGLSNMGHSLWRALDLVDRFKSLGKHVVVGGTMSSLVPDWVGQHADTVMVGDTEQTWPCFLADFESGRPQPRYVEPRRHPVADLPLPRYDLLMEKTNVGPLMPVQIARGCPYRCRFCTINALSEGDYTTRPLDHILRDIQALVDVGERFFFFMDDNIAGDLAFAHQLFDALCPLSIRWVGQSTLDLLKEEGLAEECVDSGCVTLCFGLESISQRSLRSVAKGFYKVERYDEQIARIREAGLMQTAEFIIGLDHDDPETISDLADYIIESAIPIVRAYIYAPIPGTPVWEDFRKKERLCSEDYREIGGAHVGFQPLNFSREGLLSSYWDMMDRIYTWKAIFRRVFGRRNRGWVNPLLALAANLNYRRCVKSRIIPGLS